MARVIAPVATFTGTVVGVTFSEGVGETSDANALAYFARHGYTVQASAAALSGATVTVAQSTPDLATATKAQIAAYVATLTSPTLSVSGLSKADTIAKLEAYRAVPTVTGVAPTGGAAAGGTSVVITGTNFAQGISAVKFDTTDATSFVVTAVAPAHAAGQVDVTVVKTAGTSATSASSKYTYA